MITDYCDQEVIKPGNTTAHSPYPSAMVPIEIQEQVAHSSAGITNFVKMQF